MSIVVVIIGNHMAPTTEISGDVMMSNHRIEENEEVRWHVGAKGRGVLFWLGKIIRPSCGNVRVMRFVPCPCENVHGDRVAIGIDNATRREGVRRCGVEITAGVIDDAGGFWEQCRKLHEAVAEFFHDARLIDEA